MENNTIESILYLIKERYSQERVEVTKQRLQALWNLLPMTDRIPYVLYGMPLKQPPMLADDVSGEQRELITQLQTIYEHAEWPDDYVPGLVPGICQVMIPAYFGCTEERTSMTSRVKPVVHDPRDVYDLPELGFGPETPGGQMLERMRYFRRETRGLLPIYEADLQGPFSVASQVWGIENFLAAIYEYPNEVHHLLSRCTDAVIKFAELMRESVDGDWIPYHCVPAVWLPPGKGIAISEDLVAVVSPQVVREFMRPCLERIAAAFGGVFLHSCGSINHVIGELNQVSGLIGLNFSSSETDLPRLTEDASDSLVLTVHNSPVSCGNLPVLDIVQHVQLCGQVFRRSRGLCIIIGNFSFPWQTGMSAPLHGGNQTFLPTFSFHTFLFF
jgi:hypothetical protein